MKPHSATGVAETHISTVFFAGDRAYKLLKPVTMDFLDFSTTRLRLQAADRELRLNRRIAPDVYLGSADVIEGSRTVDRFIVMRRLPADRRLATLLAGPEVHGHLRSVARAVAQFHASQPAIRDAPMASAAAVRRNWDDNVSSMMPFVDSILDVEKFERVRALYQRYIDGRGLLFENRIRAGLVRDAHGDLTAQDVFCMDDGPRILDCLAFSDELRICDVLNDVAFLAMDIERLSTPERAKEFMRSYLEFSNEHHPASLLDHFVAYRAHVRAKVACLRFGQGDEDSAEEARTYIDLALRHLEAAEVRLVLVGGGPGTGKTTVSNRLGSEMDWIVLNSDQLRKDLAGRSYKETVKAPFGEGIYSTEFTEHTYATLIDRAGYLLRQGESVVLDASWPTEELRERARQMAGRSGAIIHEFECVLSSEVCKKRIAERMVDPDRVDTSDATPKIVDAALADRKPWPAARALDTTDAVDSLVGVVVEVIATQRLERANAV